MRHHRTNLAVMEKILRQASSLIIVAGMADDVPSPVFDTLVVAGEMLDELEQRFLELRRMEAGGVTDE